MNTRIQYVGLDVDDKGYQGHIRAGREETAIPFRTKPNVGSLTKRLEEFKKPGYEYKICYEATYLGFSLQRELGAKGYKCEVIASSLIPKESGRRVKTDRIDSKKLAEYYQKGLLTSVHVPDNEEEKVRALLRSRKFIVGQLKGIKVHILANCRRDGLNYRGDIKKPDANYWTVPHMQWLRSKLKNMDKLDVMRMNIALLLNQVQSMEQQIALYDERINNIAEQDQYIKKVKALCCYRGLSTLSAMTLITELGDIRRFDHPNRITSYCGMDIQEYTSGGKEKKYGITKMGNSQIRTTVVEACQSASKTPAISKQLRERRKDATIEMIRVADKCMKRLYKKSMKMFYRDKRKNVIKVACARELLGFVWESLMLVEVA